MLEEIADVSAAGGGQRTLAALEKLRELLDVGAIRGNGERRQSLLNLQVVEKRVHDGVAGAGRHATSMRVGTVDSVYKPDAFASLSPTLVTAALPLPACSSSSVA